MSTQTGSYIAFAAIIVAIALHFGLVLDSQVVGQTITDIVKTIADIGVLYGTIHQFFVTKKVVVAAKAAGAYLK